MHEQMHATLARRYPGLYGRDGSVAFDCKDGWFVILDALSAVLVSNAESDSRSPGRVAQVKEKMGTLRYYYDGSSEADDGAISMAEELSGRLCEATGRPGRLGSRSGWVATRAPGLDGITYAEPFMHAGRIGVPVLGFTRDEMRAWRADVLNGEVDVPAGWLDLADGLLRKLSDHQAWLQRTTPGASIRATRLAASPAGALEVDHVGGDAFTGGIVAIAVAISRRLDPATGSAEPEPG